MRSGKAKIHQITAFHCFFEPSTASVLRGGQVTIKQSRSIWTTPPTKTTPQSSPNLNEFYKNGVIERYASADPNRVTLRQLAFFGRNLTEEKLIKSANYIRNEIPVRLAHRIAEFQQLPFIVGTNPHIAHLYGLYWSAFDRIRSFPEIRTLEQNHEFCDLIASTLTAHLVAIPQLSLGMSQSQEYMSPESAHRFMSETLTSRIGRRVLAEQHLALSRSFQEHQTTPHNSSPSQIGIINVKCSPASLISHCVDLAAAPIREIYGVQPPEVCVDGHTHDTFIYIPHHIKYILYEVLNNSLWFTMMKHAPDSILKQRQPQQEVVMSRMKRRPSIYTEQFWPRESATCKLSLNEPLNVDSFSSLNDKMDGVDLNLPPIRVTVGNGGSNFIFRISDQAGGIAREKLDHLWSFSPPNRFEPAVRLTSTSGDMQEELVYPGIGLGLPLSQVYARYWGGELSVYTMHGYGTDMYVSIAVGNQLENLASSSLGTDWTGK